MSAGALSNITQLANQQAQANSANGSKSAGQTGSNPYANMESGEFVKLLVQQLTSQDPMNPQDSSKILEQLSSIRNIETQMQLQGKLGDLVAQNQVSKASGLIGKRVEGVGENDETVEGRVTSVRVQDDKAVLELDTGKRLGMNQVTMVAAPAATER
jgi:flagellar basal-body rod modification protein FlgD